MKQKSWTWMLAAMLTLCGTTTVMTSCSDDDSTTSGSTPSQEIDEQLLGSWTMDVDGIDSLDLATLDLRFNKDQTMQLVINCYNAESDGYLSVPINASYHAIDPKDINGTTAKGLKSPSTLIPWWRRTRSIIRWTVESSSSKPKEKLRMSYLAI